MSSTWRVALLGGLLGLATVAIVAWLVLSGLVPTGDERTQASAEGPVIVALVLPDANGVNVPRVIDLYSRADGKLTLTTIDPEQSATVSGTSAKTLADAYTFGGGAALVRAHALGSGATEPAWIVVGQDAWDALREGTPVSIDIPAPLEVFDGSRLYSYPQGAVSVPVAEVRHVLDGAQFLSSQLRRSVRVQLGDGIAESLATSGKDEQLALRTNLSDEDLAAWLAIFGPAVRAQGE